MFIKLHFDQTIRIVLQIFFVSMFRNQYDYIFFIN